MSERNFDLAGYFRLKSHWKSTETETQRDGRESLGLRIGAASGGVSPMADKKSESTPAAATEGAAAPKKGGGLKFVLMTVVLLAVEAGVLFALFAAGQPKGANADHIAAGPEKHAEEAKFDDFLAFDGKATNDLSGATFQYGIRVYFTVRESHKAKLEDVVKRAEGRIQGAISDIARTAEPQHFREPLFDTLRRRIETSMRALFDKQYKVDGAAAGGHGTEEFIEIEGVTVIIGSGIRISR